MGQQISRRLFLKGGLATAAGLAASSIPGATAAAESDDRKQLATLLDIRKCIGCEACVGVCPVEAIFTTSNRKKGVDQDKCVKCGECRVVCPPEYDAVEKVSPPDLAPVVERPAEPGKQN